MTRPGVVCSSGGSPASWFWALCSGSVVGVLITRVWRFEGRFRVFLNSVANQSMSRKGNCFDNAVIENFFGHLREVFHHVRYLNIDALATALDELLTTVENWFWPNFRASSRKLGQNQVSTVVHKRFPVPVRVAVRLF
jgi:hypothetical protein